MPAGLGSANGTSSSCLTFRGFVAPLRFFGVAPARALARRERKLHGTERTEGEREKGGELSSTLSPLLPLVEKKLRGWISQLDTYQENVDDNEKRGESWSWIEKSARQ